MCAKKCECDEVPCFTLILIQTCNKLMHSTNYRWAPKVCNPFTLFTCAVCCSCSRAFAQATQHIMHRIRGVRKRDAHKVEGSKKSNSIIHQVKLRNADKETWPNPFFKSHSIFISYELYTNGDPSAAAAKRQVTKSRKWPRGQKLVQPYRAFHLHQY
jgi:Ni/Co efflux regulator RcnB